MYIYIVYIYIYIFIVNWIDKTPCAVSTSCQSTGGVAGAQPSDPSQDGALQLDRGEGRRHFDWPGDQEAGVYQQKRRRDCRTCGMMWKIRRKWRKSTRTTYQLNLGLPVEVSAVQVDQHWSAQSWTRKRRLISAALGDQQFPPWRWNFTRTILGFSQLVLQSQKRNLDVFRRASGFDGHAISSYLHIKNFAQCDLWRFVSTQHGSM